MLVAAAAVGFIASGCHSVTLVQKEESNATGAPAAAPDAFSRQGSVLFGIRSITPAADVSCGRGAAEVKIRTSLWDTVIHFMIGPFYTTRSVEVYCKK